MLNKMISRLLLKNQNIFVIFQRKCADLSIVKTHLDVPSFCDIHINVPCKVRITPLNVNKYHNFNDFILQTDQKYNNEIEHYIDGNKIVVKADDLNPNTLCSIKAPVKANLHITAGNDVSVGYFRGDKINIKTNKNVFVDRFQGESIDILTKNGNVILNNFIQSANISAKTINGTIKTGRLQALNLKLKTKLKGDILVDASYCEDSEFEVENGNMNLNNIHKDCKIFILKGNLSLAGFEGKLSAILNAGSADIYLSKITGNSDITLNNKGEKLDLKINDSCLDDATFKIHSKTVSCSENVINNVDNSDDDHTNSNCVTLKSSHSTQHRHATNHLVTINSLNNNVNIEKFTWQEMIENKLKNK